MKRIVAGALVLGLAACGSPGSDAIARRTVADTTFVTSPADGVDGPAQIAEEFRIPPSRLEIGQLDAAVFGPNGTIWVYDSRGKNGEVLHVLDSAGNAIATAGHHGTGPGEFQAPARLFRLANNSILVKEMFTTRAVRFGPGGNTLATITLPVAVTNGWVVTPDNAGGWFIAASFEANTPKRTGRYGWMHFDSNAVVIDTVSPPAAFFEEPSPDGIAPGRIRTAGRDRSVLTTVPGPSRLERIAADGKVTFMDWRAEPPRYLDDERRDMQEIEDKLNTLMGLPPKPLPDRKAAVTRILTDSGGRVWAELSTVGERIPAEEIPAELAPGGVPQIKWRESRDRWAAFDPDGTMRFTVTMPPRASLRDRSGDRLLGQVLDADNVPTLVVWRIVRTGTGH